MGTPAVDTGAEVGLFGLPARPPGQFRAAIPDAVTDRAPLVLRLLAETLADRLDEMVDGRRYRGLVPLAAELRILLQQLAKDYGDASPTPVQDPIAALMAEFEAAESARVDADTSAVDAE